MRNDFSNLKTDEERVIYTFNVLIDYNIVPKDVVLSKSSEQSKKFKEDGNLIFTSPKTDVHNFVEAFECYTNSIAFAENGSRELALGYANRSAVLFQFHKYKECILDIDRALQLDYPDELKGKLYIRKGECLKILKETSAQETLEKARYWIEKLPSNNQNRINLIKKLQSIINNSYTGNKWKIRKEWPINLPEITNQNAEVPCASDAIEIKYDDICGRHVVATRDISPGEVLVIEKPHSKLLAPKNKETHCSNCLNVCWSTVPCEHCTYALYCSEECKLDEWEKYHNVECGIYPLLLEMDFTKLDLLGIRTAIQALREYNDLEKLKEEITTVDSCEEPRIKGFSTDGKFCSEKYRSFYSLVTNTDKRSMEDLFRRAFDTCYILYYLATQSTLFGEKLKGDFKILVENHYVTFVGGLIMRHQQSVPTIMHSFSEEGKYTCDERGVVAMPFLSLLNHSCNPNTIRSCTTDRMILYALYPIHEGAEIFDNYGLIYGMCDTVYRQIQLQNQYHFTCDCEACINNWPDYWDLPSYRV